MQPKLRQIVYRKIDTVDAGDKAGVYEIPFYEEYEQKKYYIGMTKHKFKNTEEH